MQIRKNIPYGSHRRQKFDLYIPKNKNQLSPLIFLAHGGAWVLGSKSTLNSLATFLAKNGFIVINFNYRLLQHVNTIDEQIQDFKSCSKYILASKLLENSQRKKIIIGESAGAHLAFLSHKIIQWDGIVSISGPLNYSQIKNLDFLPLNSHKWFLPYLLKNKEKSSNNWKKISPIYQDIDCPVLLFQGKKDPLVPFKDAIELRNTLERKNIPVRLYLIPQWKHIYRAVHKKSQNFVYNRIKSWLLKNY